MTYDNWKTTNPDDRFLGPEPLTPNGATEMIQHLTQYTLFDHGHPVRTETNLEGLRLQTLFRVNNGDRVVWQPTDEPAQVALERGFVNGKHRFHIAVLD